ncbi:hypothetical protein ALC57_04701 [Trachymyrmex cornetzi]|uniref:Uncharacterized protein n=1 Tax=Trachymyrmex cornetzi TaxID=471704 RepID=A0A195ECH6_9HYME|nr:hypothetical protein ALC57_04701 [Trachymyrmex cornetzi]
MLHARTDLIFPFGGAQFHETFGTSLWHRAIPYEIAGAYTMHWSEKKTKKYIRDPISIRPTVTIFTNSPTFGCGGRSSGMKELYRREQGGNPFNLSLCTATRANSCKERKDTPGIAFSGGASTGNEITGLPLKLARLANNRAYYVAFVSTALLSPCAAKARLALHVFLSVFAKGIWARIVVGYFFPWYPSAMDKVSSHFARSPFAHPRAVFFSSSWLSPLPCLSIFQRFALASVTLAPRSRPLPLPFILLFLCIFFGVFCAVRETSSACRNEFHVSTDSLIAGGLDDRVNRRQRTSFFLSTFFTLKILM